MHENGNGAASDDPTRPARQFRATGCNPPLSTRAPGAESLAAETVPLDLVDPAQAMTLSRAQVQAMLKGTSGARIESEIHQGNDSKLRRLLRRMARLLS